jgi:hypothetical protein
VRKKKTLWDGGAETRTYQEIVVARPGHLESDRVLCEERMMRQGVGGCVAYGWIGQRREEIVDVGGGSTVIVPVILGDWIADEVAR